MKEHPRSRRRPASSRFHRRIVASRDYSPTTHARPYFSPFQTNTATFLLQFCARFPYSPILPVSSPITNFVKADRLRLHGQRKQPRIFTTRSTRSLRTTFGKYCPGTWSDRWCLGRRLTPRNVSKMSPLSDERAWNDFRGETQKFIHEQFLRKGNENYVRATHAFLMKNGKFYELVNESDDLVTQRRLCSRYCFSYASVLPTQEFPLDIVSVPFWLARPSGNTFLVSFLYFVKILSTRWIPRGSPVTGTQLVGSAVEATDNRCVKISTNTSFEQTLVVINFSLLPSLQQWCDEINAV